MTSRARLIFLVAALLVLGLLAAPGPSAATVLVKNSGPNIKTELFKSDGTSAIIWEEIAFSFALPDTATGNGLFRMFAGGDLNNISIDWIDVTAGPFGDRTLLGTFAFPISDVHFTACENPPHANPMGCPVPESVPGGDFYDDTRFPVPVGDVEGRKDVTMFSAGTPGLVVPQELLVGGTNLLISLFPRDPIFDLYIDRLELSYPSPTAVPEPGSLALLALSLALFGFAARLRASRAPGKVPARVPMVGSLRRLRLTDD